MKSGTWTWKRRTSPCELNIKGCTRFFRKRPEEVKTSERHLFIEAFKEKYFVNEMCKYLKISESGYYRWLKNKSNPTSRQLLSVEIQKIIDQHPDNDNYGVLRMKTALEQNGITTSKRTVSRTMSEMELLHSRKWDCYIKCVNHMG